MIHSSMASILHLGMPKCMSTSLQAVFRDHPEAYFMGIGLSGLLSDDVLKAVQQQLIYVPDMFYDRAFVERVFKAEMEKAEAENYPCFVLSDENIVNTFDFAYGGVSYRERLERLKAVMPEETVPLLIVRRPFALLWSWYRYGYVMQGNSLTFDEFVRLMLLRGDTWQLAWTKYAYWADEAKAVFGDVRVLSMEAILADPSVLGFELAQFNLTDVSKPPKENAGLGEGHFPHFVRLHAALGDSLTLSAYNMLLPYEVRLAQQDQPFATGLLARYLVRHQQLGGLRQMAEKMGETDGSALRTLSEDTKARLKDYVGEANARLRDTYGIDTDGLGYNTF